MNQLATRLSHKYEDLNLDSQDPWKRLDLGHVYDPSNQII